ncbi:hypothetical protein [Mycobacterium tuberculosis]|uniref:hypothetical protein n=1 Tax=Mycobacterium tuberculosis TaxID=1773 RepID=UPI00272C815D|nr:hypothetical protein [Mycobacterium tuberculosis]
MPLPSQIKIRLATPDDANALVILITEHAAFEEEAYSPEGKVEKIRECLSADPPPFTCLVFSLNKEHILASTEYGVHPFKVGVMVQLPTPRDLKIFFGRQT